MSGEGEVDYVVRRGRDRPMPATRTLLARWDRTTNPIFLAAAGQLREALREDRRNDVALACTPAPTSEPTP